MDLLRHIARVGCDVFVVATANESGLIRNGKSGCKIRRLNYNKIKSSQMKALKKLSASVRRIRKRWKIHFELFSSTFPRFHSIKILCMRHIIIPLLPLLPPLIVALLKRKIMEIALWRHFFLSTFNPMRWTQMEAKWWFQALHRKQFTCT